MTDRKKWKSIGERLEQRLPSIFWTSLKVEKETGVKKEEIKEVLDTKPYNELSAAVNTDIKQQQEEYIDKWLQEEEFRYTDRIIEIISYSGFTLDAIYYKKIADRILEKNWWVSLFEHHYHRLALLIDKGNLGISYREWIFLSSSNWWWEGGGWSVDQAQDVFNLLTWRNLDKKYYEMFIQQIIHSKKRRERLSLDSTLKFIRNALELWKFDNEYYKKIMLIFIDSELAPSTNEIIGVLDTIFQHGFEVSFFQEVLDVITKNKELFSRLHSTDVFRKLCTLAEKEFNQAYYIQIVNTCVDDFLQGTHKEMDKRHIEIALNAVKQGKLSQEYYDKVMKAGMELLVTS